LIINSNTDRLVLFCVIVILGETLRPKECALDFCIPKLKLPSALINPANQSKSSLVKLGRYSNLEEVADGKFSNNLSDRPSLNCALRFTISNRPDDVKCFLDTIRSKT